MSDTKKLYLVSIHSFRGSMWESTGKHNLVEMTEEDYEKLSEEYDGEEIASEMGVVIRPITKTLDFEEISSILQKTKESGQEDDIDELVL